MGRILAIDYGTKKIGLAVTDPLQIVVNPLSTLPSSELADFLQDYLLAEEVEEIVLGIPHHPDGNEAQLAPQIRALGRKIGKLYPQVLISFQDESYTSRDALAVIRQAGVSKKKRQDKSLVDKISAVLILQTYLKHI